MMCMLPYTCRRRSRCIGSYHSRRIGPLWFRRGCNYTVCSWESYRSRAYIYRTGRPRTHGHSDRVRWRDCTVQTQHQSCGICKAVENYVERQQATTVNSATDLAPFVGVVMPCSQLTPLALLTLGIGWADATAGVWVTNVTGLLTWSTT